jgi:4-methyl-5(b-hydroxyethyl)-thiazole monophosphate biosynthesis
VRGSHGIPVTPDLALGDLAGQAGEWDGVLLPGGLPGASNLAASAGAEALVKAMAGAGKLICAICASPALVLAPWGLLADRRFTCFPGMEGDIPAALPRRGFPVEDRVVTDGNLITSRGAGTAAEWAVSVIAALAGPEAAQRVAASVLLPGT